jgi:DNA-binding PadR family transcriptional regulator
MSEIPDKRRRTDLDLFILALIDSGISTPYEFQKAAGLSQGATIPALQRLLEARLVRQEKPGTRGRTGYKVSAAGKKTLREGWQTLIAAGPSGNLDSDLRVALLAMLGSGNRLLAVDFLRRSAEEKAVSVATAEPMIYASDLPPLARWYTDLRSETAKALLTAELHVIRSMAEALPKKISDKFKQGPNTSRKQKRA